MFSITDNKKQLNLFLLLLLLSLLPGFLHLLICLSLILLPVFFIICVLDFITKGSYRKKAAEVFIPVITSTLISLLFFYFIFSLNG